MTGLADFIRREEPADLMGQAAAILDFLNESLSRQAGASQDPLSDEALDGLALICLHLSLLCREAAREG